MATTATTATTAAMMINYNPHNKAAQEAINSLITSGTVEYYYIDPAKQEQLKPKKKTASKGYTYDVVPPELQASIDRARADYKAGRYRRFTSAKEVVKYLDSL
jgi:hypothetical protein